MNNRGFTLLELMLVIAILAVLSVGAVLSFFSYQTQTEIDSAAKNVVNALRDAQSRAMSGKDFKAWGVCFDISGNKVVLFRNDCNLNGIMDNGEIGIDCGGGGCFDCNETCSGVSVKEESYLSSFVKINSVSFAGGGNKVIFSALEGSVAQYGTIQLEGVGSSSNHKNVTITNIGKIDSQ